jgi:hypothetical protein
MTLTKANTIPVERTDVDVRQTPKRNRSRKKVIKQPELQDEDHAKRTDAVIHMKKKGLRKCVDLAHHSTCGLGGLDGNLDVRQSSQLCLSFSAHH